MPCYLGQCIEGVFFIWFYLPLQYFVFPVENLLKSFQLRYKMTRDLYPKNYVKQGHFQSLQRKQSFHFLIFVSYPKNILFAFEMHNIPTKKKIIIKINQKLHFFGQVIMTLKNIYKYVVRMQSVEEINLRPIRLHSGMTFHKTNKKCII